MIESNCPTGRRHILVTAGLRRVRQTPSRLPALTFDANDPARLAGFWAGVLGRVHLHLTSTSPTDQQSHQHHLPESTVAAALELGAGHLDVGQLPEAGHVALADPDGNEFCLTHV